MVIAITVAVVAALIVGKIAKDKEDEEVCPPHKWSVVHGTERMQCILCNKQIPIHPFI